MGETFRVSQKEDKGCSIFPLMNHRTWRKSVRRRTPYAIKDRESNHRKKNRKQTRWRRFSLILCDFWARSSSAEARRLTRTWCAVSIGAPCGWSCQNNDILVNKGCCDLSGWIQKVLKLFKNLFVSSLFNRNTVLLFSFMRFITRTKKCAGRSVVWQFLVWELDIVRRYDSDVVSYLTNIERNSLRSKSTSCTKFFERKDLSSSTWCHR